MTAMVGDWAAPGEADSPALALVNTLRSRAGAQVDDLPDPGAVWNWMVERRLITPSGSRAAKVPAPSMADMPEVGRLREAIRELFTAWTEARPAGTAAVDLVNRTCAAVPMVAQLTWAGPQGPQMVVRATARIGLPCALATIAADAIDLVTGERRTRLRACQAPDCPRFLIADHARRTWCSTACNDRTRARRYYQRQKAEAGEP